MSKTITKQNNLTEIEKSLNDVINVSCCLEFIEKALSLPMEEAVELDNLSMSHLLRHLGHDLSNSYGILSDFLDSISNEKPQDQTE